jgi:hypothetical protein
MNPDLGPLLGTFNLWLRLWPHGAIRQHLATRHLQRDGLIPTGARLVQHPGLRPHL